MKKTTKLIATLGVSSILALGGLAQAQDQPAGAAGAGTITNETTTATETTTVTAPADDLIAEGDVTTTETLPDTGGAPLLMSLGGALMAGSALLLRRKIS